MIIHAKKSARICQGCSNFDVWFVELVLKNQRISSFILSSPISGRPGN
jgi:hypothetical protein